MTDMIHLIVPPIIVVFAVAILVVFLAKNISSDNDGGNFVLKKVKKRPKLQGLRSKSLNEKKEDLKEIAKKITKKEKIVMPDKDVATESSNGAGAANARDTRKNGNGKEKVVSLRKKSMVSDKIENSEGRNPEEVSLMNEIEKSPQDSKGYEKLGDYYMEHEQFEDARECYKYVLRLDPRHKRAQVAMKNLDRVL